MINSFLILISFCNISKQRYWRQYAKGWYQEAQNQGGDPGSEGRRDHQGNSYLGEISKIGLIGRASS